MSCPAGGRPRRPSNVSNGPRPSRPGEAQGTLEVASSTGGLLFWFKGGSLNGDIDIDVEVDGSIEQLFWLFRGGSKVSSGSV